MSQVLGIRELQANIRSLNAELDAAEDPAATAAAEPIADAWRGMVPVLDGHYRDAISIVWLDGKAAIGTAWDPSLPRDEQPYIYSTVLEYGNSDTPAQPSARPALKASRGAALEAGAVPLRAAVKRRRRRRTR